MELPRPLRGIVPPLVTPLASVDDLDVPGVGRLIQHVLRADCSGVFVLGSTGEAQSLSYRLRVEMIRRTCELAGGRVPVLAGVSDTSVVESIRLAEEAATAGASALVLAPPYYFRMSQADLLRHVEMVAEATPLPVFLYNMPSLTKLNYEPETVRAAAAIPGVVGLKDSSGDLLYLQRVLRSVADVPGFSVLVGPEELLAPGLLLGAHGGVSGGANAWPELYVALYRAAAQGHNEEAARLQQQVLEISESVYRVGYGSTAYVRGLKCALELLGVCSGLPAAPLEAMNADEREQVRLAIPDSLVVH